MLSFCRPDIHYLLLAFTFLLVGALSNTLTPFYLGKVVNHIVVTADVTSFYYSLMILVAIQVVSSISTGNFHFEVKPRLGVPVLSVYTNLRTF